MSLLELVHTWSVFYCHKLLDYLLSYLCLFVFSQGRQWPGRVVAVAISFHKDVGGLHLGVVA